MQVISHRKLTRLTTLHYTQAQVTSLIPQLNKTPEAKQQKLHGGRGSALYYTS